MNFGQKLRRLRIKKGLTQQQIAERLGYVTNSYISDVEKGAFIPSEEKLKISSVKTSILVDLERQVVLDLHLTTTRRHDSQIAPAILRHKNVSRFFQVKSLKKSLRMKLPIGGLIGMKTMGLK